MADGKRGLWTVEAETALKDRLSLLGRALGTIESVIEVLMAECRKADDAFVAAVLRARKMKDLRERVLAGEVTP